MVVFTIRYNKNILKFYNPGQFIFGYDMIILIKYNIYLDLLCQRNQVQVNIDNNCENLKRVCY